MRPLLPLILVFSSVALSACCDDDDDDDGTGGGGTQTTTTGATSTTASTTGSSSTSQSSSSGTCTADTMTDPQNCGGCGMPCGVGTCVQGMCQTAQTLATGLATLTQITHDDTTLFFASGGHAMLYLDGGVFSLPLDGGEAPTYLATGIPAVEAVHLDGANLLFASSGSNAENFTNGYLGSIPKLGGASSIVAAGQFYAQDILVQDGATYVASGGTYPDFVDGFITKIDGASTAVFVSGLLSPDALATDGTYLYWTVRSTTPDAADGKLERKLLAGGETETLRDDLDRPGALLWVGSHLFVGTRDRILELDPATPDAATEFANEGKQAGLFAADAQNLYWTEPAGRVLRKKLTGGDVIVLAEGLVQPWGITLTDTHAYFTDRGTGANDSAVLRIAK